MCFHTRVSIPATPLSGAAPMPSPEVRMKQRTDLLGPPGLGRVAGWAGLGWADFLALCCVCDK